MEKYKNTKGVLKMENIQKEWKLYVKKILLNNLYNKNINEKIIDFLKNYDLLRVDVLNDDDYEFEMDVLFNYKNETVSMNAQFEARDWCFYWTLPGELDIMELEEILERFNFDRYTEKV
jgi:hypothetical protein